MINPNDGYKITIDHGTSFSSTPVMGSDGNNYYGVGEPVVIGAINSSSIKVNATGTVTCMGKKWGANPDSGQLHNATEFHRLFVYVPDSGVRIGGKKTYRINNNVVVTIESYYGMVDSWIKLVGGACGYLGSTGVPATNDINSFVIQFPFTMKFYIKDKIVDGQLVVAPSDLAGYVRVFQSGAEKEPPFSSWLIGETTAPIRLGLSQIKIPSSCQTISSTGQAGTVNLRHGQLNSLNYDSLVSETVTYTCSFTKETPIRFRLDYTTDSDPQKRLPMFNNQNKDNKIYSELKLVDSAGIDRGRDFKINIRDGETFTISSHIHGSNAIAGSYQGSAWLIATFE
ncbi:adhesin [Proteus sp. G2665]|uniref:Adhesin n=1 Tax=Proteus penneri TaxID=102862 RepID=A0ABS0VZF1_9GAMM|nr:adhesin [Proteus penneri]NBM13184.1 adhesin [Proteus sp. G2670]NBM34359.1 adhesin [Proteus sp. G2664]NBM67795.1 adhesin [Proteus sp. G2663]NBM87966.1 adhesin [Proteus sp. G2661]NBN03798.1 adhesin [Proteus sp. G2665]